MKADTISCYSLCKEAHHKRDLAKSPHEYSCTKVYEVDVFSRNSTTLQNTPTILFAELLAPRLHGRREMFLSSHAARVRGR